MEPTRRAPTAAASPIRRPAGRSYRRADSAFPANELLRVNRAIVSAPLARALSTRQAISRTAALSATTAPFPNVVLRCRGMSHRWWRRRSRRNSGTASIDAKRELTPAAQTRTCFRRARHARRRSSRGALPRRVCRTSGRGRPSGTSARAGRERLRVFEDLLPRFRGRPSPASGRGKAEWRAHPAQKEMGLGAQWHREALFLFASGPDAWSRTPTLAKLCLDFSSSMSRSFHAWPRRFQSRARFNCRRCEARSCLARSASFSHRDPAACRVVQLARWRHSISLRFKSDLTIAATSRDEKTIHHCGSPTNSARQSSITNFGTAASLPQRKARDITRRVRPAPHPDARAFRAPQTTRRARAKSLRSP